MLWFSISCTGDSGRSFIRSGRNGWLNWLRFRLRAESSLGGPGSLEMAEMNFLGALEIPSSEKGYFWWFGCSVSALVRGFLVVLSSNKAASLSWLVIVEIGGMSLSSPPNLGTLSRRGAGSSETEMFRLIILVGVHGSGKSSSNFSPLGKYGDKRATTLDRFSRIFHNFIWFNIHILSDRNWMTPMHSHIVTGFHQEYRPILNDFWCIALGRLDQIRHAALPRTGTGETIGVIVRYW